MLCYNIFIQLGLPDSLPYGADSADWKYHAISGFSHFSSNGAAKRFCPPVRYKPAAASLCGMSVLPYLRHAASHPLRNDCGGGDFFIPLNHTLSVW